MKILSFRRAMGRELAAAAQTELTIGNLVRRVLFLIREEHQAFSRYSFRIIHFRVEYNSLP
jgi:hypothetical protein